MHPFCIFPSAYKLKNVLEYDPQNRIAWNVMGAAYRDLRNFPKAIEANKNEIIIPYLRY